MTRSTNSMFNEAYINQVKLLLQVLAHMDWKESFALKGGTAINLFYQNMPRLSVDIDLVYLPLGRKYDAMKDVREQLYHFQQKLTKLGLRASHTGLGANNPFGKLVISNQQASIIVEPNPVNRGAVLEPILKPLVSSAVEEFEMEVDVKCLAEPELYAGKFIAMLDRQHPRDIFDMMQFLEQHKNIDELMDLIMVYLIQSNRPFHEILNPNLRDITDDFKLAFQGMTKIPVELEQLVKYRKMLIDQLHQSLKKSHIELLISLLNNKPQWDLLPFESLNEFPGIKWRLQNLEKMDEAKRLSEVEKLKVLQ